MNKLDAWLNRPHRQILGVGWWFWVPWMLLAAWFAIVGLVYNGVL